MDVFQLRLKFGSTLLWTLLVVGLLGMFSPSAVAQDEIKKPGQSATVEDAQGVTPKPSIAETTSSTDTSARSRSHFGNGRRRGALRRQLGPEDIQNVIAVAKDVSPEWAESLQSRYEEDPQALTESIRQSGRRLLGLAMLRDRDPAIYEVRVGELRCNRELSTVTIEYQEAVRDGRNEDAEELRSKIRNLVKESLDFELRARALELAALDKALRDLKSQLQIEIATQDERLEQRLNEVLAVNPPSEVTSSNKN